LIHAQRTCETLDEKSGKLFNVLWLNPQDPDSFPKDLLDALEHRSITLSRHGATHGMIRSQLRLQMQADTLRPLNSDMDKEDASESLHVKEVFSPETIEEVTHFIRLNITDRLQLVLAYLREKYAYCFWCGAQYADHDEMNEQCPGPEEDVHD